MADEIVNVNEFQALAKQALPKKYYDFIAGGAEDEHTLKQNMEAFKRIKLLPRVLVDVSKIALSTTILGYSISTPIMIAPTSMHKLAHPEGEVATARAAASCNTIMILSSMATCRMEEVAASCNAVRFFQLYVFTRRDITCNLVKKAEKNGYKAIVLTTDSARLGRREADIKNKMIILHEFKKFQGLTSTEVVSVSKISVTEYFLFLYQIQTILWRLQCGAVLSIIFPFTTFIYGGLLQDKGSNSEALETTDPSLSWKDVAWLKSITSLPILIKGILTREDATKAMEVGVAGIVVSNHGARQLDYTPATISVLEEVVQAVGGKVPVLLDGGVRRGKDVFKALALGAQAVLIGRPVIYGLAAKGEAGVRTVLQMLKDELELTMALAGCPSLKDITRSHVRTESQRLQSML